MGDTGSLTTSIRRKLQDGKTSDEVVKELVGTGLTAVSAQRFVDRAIAEDASAPPLPPPVDSIDDFIAQQQAQPQKSGHKSLIAGSLLMCGGIIVTGVSYIMADVGERYTLMWGPVVFGLIVIGQAVVNGLKNPREFAWLAAAGAVGLPVVLGGALWAFVVASEPTPEEAMRMQLERILEEAEPAPGQSPKTPR
jgi:hypothetical protein